MKIRLRPPHVVGTDGGQQQITSASVTLPVPCEKNVFSLSLSKGSKMDALDATGKWYAAKVVDERGEGDARELLVHYYGWKASFDEWVNANSYKLRPSTEHIEEEVAKSFLFFYSSHI